MPFEDLHTFLKPEFHKIRHLGSEPRTVDSAPLLANLVEFLPRMGRRAESYGSKVVVPWSGEDTLIAAVEVLNSRSEGVLAGPPVEVHEPTLAAVIRSGFLGLNLTGVAVQLIAADEESSTLLVSAVAREGLISQHSAKKAVDVVIRDLGARLALTQQGG